MIAADDFMRVRPQLFGLAYRMLGTRAEAEEIVQDAWLRSVDRTDIENAEAWLTTTTTRLAIDRLRLAYRQRETYVGSWLAEPIANESTDPVVIVERDETITLSFLHALERLSPVERAVFLLHDVFGSGYDEVAVIVDRSNDATRQIAHRARERVREARPRFDLSTERKKELVDAFFVALATGDEAALRESLAADVVLVSDGGATTRAARRPVLGALRVARFLANVSARVPTDPTIEFIVTNGCDGLLVRSAGAPYALFVVEPDAGGVRRIELVRAPDKLAGFGGQVSNRTLET